MTGPTEKISRHNYRAFLWHAGFLALASSFMDVDTIMPSVIADSGGTAFHIGLLLTIMLGGSSVSQLVFASYLHSKSFKKRFLLLGINITRMREKFVPIISREPEIASALERLRELLPTIRENLGRPRGQDRDILFIKDSQG